MVGSTETDSRSNWRLQCTVVAVHQLIVDPNEDKSVQLWQYISGYWVQWRQQCAVMTKSQLVVIVQIFFMGMNKSQLSWDVVGVSLLLALFMGLHVVFILFAEELW